MAGLPDTAALPLTGAELEHLAASWAWLGHGRPAVAVLAVSGGVDSMALMHITQRLAGVDGIGRVIAATVDHGLRPESAQEARFVAQEAHKIGIEHVTLTWEGPKPAAGIQAAAREARYRLLVDFCVHAGGAGSTTLATAHTLDDQAETVIMRLARGSGVEGLSGIAPVTQRPGRIALTRPLLGLPKARLAATMELWNKPWLDDPSNQNDSFERVRVRRGLLALDELGVSSEAIACSARRLGEVRHAMAWATRGVLSNRELVRIDPLGAAFLDTKLRWEVPEAVFQRVLGAVICSVGGAQRHISLQTLEILAREVRQPGTHGHRATFGFCLVEATGEGVQVVREIGRNRPPSMLVRPGEERAWDGRFVVRVEDWATQAYEVRPLGKAGVQALKDQGFEPNALNPQVLEMAPGFWIGSQLMAAPIVVGSIEGLRREPPCQRTLRLLGDSGVGTGLTAAWFGPNPALADTCAYED